MFESFHLVRQKKEKFPLCACGCGERVKSVGSTFRVGHHNKSRIFKDCEKPLCACGCGLRVKEVFHQYVAGHQCKKAGKASHKKRTKPDSYSGRQIPLCACGCNQPVRSLKNRYLHGHNRRGCPSSTKGRVRIAKVPKEELPLCQCGCGERVKNPWSDFLPGHPGRLWRPSEAWKQAARERSLQRAEEQCRELGLSFPFKGTVELVFLSELQKYTDYHIDLDFRACGYILDGFIHELNLAIEFDEPWHNTRRQKARDRRRQKQIVEETKCSFWRVPSKEWETSPLDVVEKFKGLIREKQKEIKVA